MAKKPTKKAQAESTLLQGYLDAIAKYEREYKKWEERATKIIRRYRDEQRQNTVDTNAAKFNILWSNVQTLVPATFARVPQPDVSRRFRDQDPTGRVAALVLERGLEFETQHYPDYRDTMTQCVHDRFLGGRGTAWIRYEPHFKDGESNAAEGQITEDVEADAPEEQLDYECAPVDYVHWKDFGHSVARTWEEVTQVWRWVYMSEEAVRERFPEADYPKLYKDGKCIIPFDATPEDLRRADRNAQQEQKKQAKICELWDKERAVAVWLSKSMQAPLDERPDPLKLQQFFPCPKPLYATLTNESLIPVPDFTLYQDQANTLDILAERAAGLAVMLQIKGVYDASADAALGRLFTEGANGTLLPVKNWQAFAEKNGLKGQTDVLDLTPIAKALEVVFLTADQQKQQVYEIMGISDIVRGSSDPNETLGAQELKGQYASMRLRAMQADVSRFATDVLQLKAQVMCSKFNPQTLVAISAAEQLSEQDKQQVYQFSPPGVDPMTGQPTPPQPVQGPDGKPIPAGPAMALLVGAARLQDPNAEAPNPLRSFRIEVNADSMIQMNEAQEKADRMEFLAANGAFMEKAVLMAGQAGAAAPIIIPLIMEMWKFGVTGFKVGKTIEGQFDEATEKLKAMAQQAPPPDPAVMQEQAMTQAKAQVAQENATKEIGLEKRAADLDLREMRFAEEQKLAAQVKEAQAQLEEQNRALAEQQSSMKVGEDEHKSKLLSERTAFDEERAAHAQEKVIDVEGKEKFHQESLEKLISQLGEELRPIVDAVNSALQQLADDANAPVVSQRGPDGRVATVQKGARRMRVERGHGGVALVPETSQ